MGNFFNRLEGAVRSLIEIGSSLVVEKRGCKQERRRDKRRWRGNYRENDVSGTRWGNLADKKILIPMTN